MGDDRDARDAQKRGGYVLVVVEAMPELLYAGVRERRGDLAERSAEDVTANADLDDIERALEAFGEHVAGEAIAERDVGEAAEHVAPFDVPVEVHIARGEQRVRLEPDLVALFRLLADVDETDRRPLRAVHLLHEPR